MFEKCEYILNFFKIYIFWKSISLPYLNHADFNEKMRNKAFIDFFCWKKTFRGKLVENEL